MIDRVGCRRALIALAVWLAALGALTVVVKSWRLAADPTPMGAPALAFVHGVTRDWSDGHNVYRLHRSGVVYPPTAWPLLWALFGWTGLQAARWIWAAASLAGLAAVGAACVRAAGPGGRLARICAWFAPFSMPALADALGVGALITITLPLAVWAVLVAMRPEASWTSDLAAGTMFTLALADPAVALPFLGAFVAAPGRLRPAALAVAAYAALLAITALVHSGNLLAEFGLWLEHLQRDAGRGYGNLQDWLFAAGRSGAFLPVSLLLLGGLYAFAWGHRAADVWLLLGISAAAGRLWVAQRIEIDALLLVPLMTTARLAASSATSAKRLLYGGGLLVSGLVLWVPLHFHFAGSTFGPIAITPAWVRAFDTSHAVISVVLLMLPIAEAVSRGRYDERWR